jgi:hypothetical protein
MKTISWSVKLRTNNGIETKTYRDLKSLSEDLRIHRSIVYRIYNGQVPRGRHKNILGIDKIG